ncbi:hypothetical protein PCANC_19344 [Puccinia coronata f. sp. avenae]|uniref:Uncharacterized protein n=1 Tax=Puccinia coronata f. sp. avenae TaxID=200324 RepID=A0A2N5S6T8_9BASI|nr:hypothetical protein PCANC_19344 [Puccinia coronata f. sp. avenae]PLW40597.1 hypothetical protein PCASD_07782 [Puccinia coronata f. sp. avenae]
MTCGEQAAGASRPRGCERWSGEWEGVLARQRRTVNSDLSQFSTVPAKKLLVSSLPVLCKLLTTFWSAVCVLL